MLRSSKSLAATAALILSSHMLSAAAAPVQWTSASGGNDHWYDVVVGPAALTWSEASAAAGAAGGYLATLTSDAENTFVFGLAQERPAAWVAFNDTFGQVRGPWLGGFQPPSSPEPAGGWQWVNGEGALVFTSWQSASPNNFGGDENALEFFGLFNQREPRWNDNSSTNPNNAYVVEWNANPVPEPATCALLFAGLGLLGIAVRRR